jgi:hypothetical protein
MSGYQLGGSTTWRAATPGTFQQNASKRHPEFHLTQTQDKVEIQPNALRMISCGNR